MLSTKSKSTATGNSDLFAELTAIAAQLLGVDETSYTGSDLEAVERAIVLQLNYMALIEPRMFVYQSESSAHSKQAVSYRGLSELTLLYPMAAALVKSVSGSGSGWDNIKAIR